MQTGTMTASNLFASSGDVPLSRLEDDRLGRRPFAEATYRLLIECPPDWPVRVAVLGGWGEGKTTIAEFVETLAVQENHLVVKFPVSTSTSIDDLWAGFAVALCKTIRDAIEAKRLPKEVDLAPCKLLEKQGLLRRIGSHAQTGGELVAIGAEAFGFGSVGKIFRSALAGGAGWMQRRLGVDDQMVRKIREALKRPNARIIVILDDLDRTDAHLVPELLLRLRDLLNIGGFSFLVPFDDGVVRRTLESKFVESGQGERFLEKIFDFEVRLPAPTASHVLMFLSEELARHVSLFPVYLLDGLRGALPTSPRRIKSLVRHMYLYRNFRQGTGASLIDWWFILCVELLRQCDRSLFDSIRLELDVNPDQAQHVTPDAVWFPIVGGAALAKSPDFRRRLLARADEANHTHSQENEVGIRVLRQWLQVLQVLSASSLSDAASGDQPRESYTRVEAIALSWWLLSFSGFEGADLHAYLGRRASTELPAPSLARVAIDLLLEYRQTLLRQFSCVEPSDAKEALVKATISATLIVGSLAQASYSMSYDDTRHKYHNYGIVRSIQSLFSQLLSEDRLVIDSDIIENAETNLCLDIFTRTSVSDDFGALIKHIEDFPISGELAAKKRQLLLSLAEKPAVEHLRWHMMWREPDSGYPILPEATDFFMGDNPPQLFKDLVFSPSSALWIDPVWRMIFFDEERWNTKWTGNSKWIKEDVRKLLGTFVVTLSASSPDKDRRNVEELVRDSDTLGRIWRTADYAVGDSFPFIRERLIRAGGDEKVLPLPT